MSQKSKSHFRKTSVIGFLHNLTSSSQSLHLHLRLWCTMHDFICIISCNSFQHPWEISISIFMGRSKLREGGWQVKSHPASKWQYVPNVICIMEFVCGHILFLLSWAKTLDFGCQVWCLSHSTTAVPSLQHHPLFYEVLECIMHSTPY